MPNSRDITPNSAVDPHELLLFKNGQVSLRADINNKIYDSSHGKWSLPDDLKSISNTSYADMKKIQADIPGFKNY